MGKSDLGARISQRTIFQIYINSNYTFFAILYLREGVYSEKTFLNGHCPDRSYPPRATGNVVLFRPSKTTFKCVLRNQIPIENDDEMVMMIVIILMFDDDNAQKSSTTMTLW